MKSHLQLSPDDSPLTLARPLAGGPWIALAALAVASLLAIAPLPGAPTADKSDAGERVPKTGPGEVLVFGLG
jgi:hypothetical protein